MKRFLLNVLFRDLCLHLCKVAETVMSKMKPRRPAKTSNSVPLSNSSSGVVVSTIVDGFLVVMIAPLGVSVSTVWEIGA